MFDFIYKKLERFATWRICLALLVVSILCYIGFQVRGAKMELPGDQKIFDVRTFGYNASEAFKLLTAMKASGRTIYAYTQVTLDFVFPLVYSSLFIILMIKLWRRQRILCFIPALAAVFDIAENITTFYLTFRFNDSVSETEWIAANSVIVQFASAFTMLKSAGLVLSLLIILFGLVVLMVRTLPDERPGRA